MAEQTPQTLNHFALLSFQESYWRLKPEERCGLRQRWLGELRQAADILHLYQVYPAEAGVDLLVWSALRGEDPATAQGYFGRFAAAMAPFRAQITLRDTLWGFTRPSQYTKVRSAQEIDPFGPERQPYLVMYPFVKTTEWYLKSREERQEMMGGHIKVGKQYPEITQLLLYSFGLQDQEFVVVYETADLVRFLNLVNELRSTEARRYTQRDYPLHTGFHQPDDQALSAWL
jgi:chlorite dismutase